ncbi:MAG: cupredoxin domain-containing protein [Proteobacteria bacterium]|nr:cupredoxin domain-containing protein [Pseudomonadota bacterium]
MLAAWAPVSMPPAPAAPAAAAAAEDVEVDLKDGGGPGPFVYAPADFTFSVGDVVNFSLVSEGVFHTFTVDDLGIDEAVNVGEVVEFSFTFDKPGTYDLICIPHQALGMVGTITVQ